LGRWRRHTAYVGGAILPGERFQVFVSTRPVDFRKGMDSLAAVVQERLRLDPFSGAVFVSRFLSGRWYGSARVDSSRRCAAASLAASPAVYLLDSSWDS
jgi:transposase